MPRRELDKDAAALAREILRACGDDWEAAVVCLQRAVTEQPAYLVRITPPELLRKVCGDFLRLTRASPHASELGKAARQKTKKEWTEDEGRRRMSRELMGMLGSYAINGKPLGYCRRMELEDAAEDSERHAIFRRSVAALLPKPEAMVMHHLTSMQIEELWRGKKSAA